MCGLEVDRAAKSALPEWDATPIRASFQEDPVLPALTAMHPMATATRHLTPISAPLRAHGHLPTGCTGRAGRQCELDTGTGASTLHSTCTATDVHLLKAGYFAVAPKLWTEF